MKLVAVSLLALLALAGPAHAGKAEQRAEINRLLQEIDKLAEKNAWSGVERAYLKLVSLDRRSEKMDHDVHLLGATAAQARGDSWAVYQRLERAQRVESREQTLVWLATLKATNTRVKLEVSPLVRGELPLETIDAITDPTQVTVLQAAQAALNEKRYFEGLLPMGRYRFGDKRFDLYGQDVVELTLWPGENQQGPSQATSAVAVVTPTDRLVLASPLDQPAADGVRFALVGVEGVQEVTVRPLPPLLVYGDFEASSLEMLELDTRSIADAASAQLGVPLGQVAVRPTSVSIPARDHGEDDLAGVLLPIGDGSVSLDAIGTVRTAPDRTAAAPGLEVKLADEADPALVKEAIRAALAESAPAKELGLNLD